MVLSIGMIVKNEEKYLERCLSALKPILDNVDSELIIADTGSTDRTVEIAKQFTDNVYHFEWIDDFSAARNSTMERAKGEWYMFIDADEIAVDCTDIINFFNSGEYKKYGSAAYIQRSYADLSNLDAFSDFRVVRLTAMRDGVKFINTIHERFSFVLRPCKDLNLIADHYGYVFVENGKVNELAKAKSERNLTLLLEELAEQEASGNVDLLVYRQIADCYSLIKEEETALEYMKKGMELCDPRSMATIMFYDGILAKYWNLNRHSEALALCKEYFSKSNIARKGTLATDCFVHLAAARANFILGNYVSAISDYVAAIDLYTRYIDHKLVTEDLLHVVFRVTVPMIKTSSECLYKCCLETGLFDEAAKILTKFPYTAPFLSDKKYMLKHLTSCVVIMEYTGFSPLAELYDKLDDENRLQLINMIFWLLFTFKNPEAVIGVLKKIAKGDKRLEDTVKLYNHFLVRNDLTLGGIQNFISEYGAKGNENIWCMMMMANLDITPYITAEGFVPSEGFFELHKKYHRSADLFINYDLTSISPEGLEKAAEVYVWVWPAVHKNSKKSMQLFERLGMLGEKWVENNPGQQPPKHIKAATVAGRIAQVGVGSEQYEEGVNNLVDILPEFKSFVVKHNEAQQPQQQQETTASRVITEEDEIRMLDNLKKRIHNSIDAGDTAGAKKYIKKYERLRPDDPEIIELKKNL